MASKVIPSAGVLVFHCRTELIPFLIRDIEAAAAASEVSKFREICAAAIMSLHAELEAADAPNDRSYITPTRFSDGTAANGS